MDKNKEAKLRKRIAKLKKAWRIASEWGPLAALTVAGWVVFMIGTFQL